MIAILLTAAALGGAIKFTDYCSRRPYSLATEACTYGGLVICAALALLLLCLVWGALA